MDRAPDASLTRKNPPDPTAELDELVVLCIERLESEGDGALERICTEHPAHASRLRTCVAALRATGMLGGEPARRHDVPEVLGDFRLLAPLGQGGMGIVYEAEQVSLGRRVALKLIRPEQLFFGGARERFRREVEAVARLAHPNIVAIHQVGEERGIPYFAMELVQGASLADVVRGLADRDPATLRGQDLQEAIGGRRGDAPKPGDPPRDDPLQPRRRSVGAREDSAEGSRLFRTSWIRASLAIVAEVAEALEHAHQRGVLHRDVKPSNVLITRGGRVLLVDFGLAALQGTHRLTQTGSQLGSLPYLPPESVRDEKAGHDARSDVYSLGVTLYELLTLHLPFHGETTQGTLQQILDGRPVALRERNRAVPPDVETVCVTAIDPDPARRYASAAAFARDLANVLELRPIEARRASARLRLVRAAQRHPAWTTGVVAAFLVVVVGPLFFALQERRARNEVIAADRKTQAANAGLATANADLATVNADLADALASVRAERDATALERERAEQNFVKAIEAVDLMLTKVGSETLREVPQMDTVRRDLLQSALRFYQDLVAQKSGNKSVRAREIEAWDRVASIQTQLGRHAEAEQAKRDQLARVEALLADHPGDFELLSKRAGTLDGIGSALLRSSRIGEALAMYEGAAAAYGEVLELQPEDERTLRSLAALHYNVGVLRKRAQEFDAAGRSLRSALRLDDELVRRGDRTAALQRSRVLTLTEIAVADRLAGRLEECEPLLREALVTVERLVAAEPRSTDLAQLHGKVLFELAGLYLETRRAAEAETLLDRSIAIYQRLVAEHPDVAFNRTMLGGVGIELAKLLWDTDRRAEARVSRAAGESEYQALVDDHPEVPNHRGNLAEAQGIGARWSLALGDARSACEEVESALRHDRAALAAAPAHPELLQLLRTHTALLGRARLADGDVPAAAAAARELASTPAATGEDLAAAAEILAGAARASAADEERARELAAAAVAALEAALRHAYRPPTDLASDARFAGLADLAPEFGRVAALAGD